MKNFEEYAKKIRDRIDYQMKLQQMNGKSLAKKCNLTEGTISKILNGGQGLSLDKLFIIAKALNMDMASLLSEGKSTHENVEELYDSIRNGYGRMNDTYSASLIFSTQFPAFKGYLNDSNNTNDYYYFYTKPTIREEKKGYLKGELRLISAETPTKTGRYCKADLKLYTGKINPETNNPYYKMYTGEMIVSLPMRSCYIILTSLDSGEINVLIFSHQFLINENLVCKLIACQTVSAGGHKRPVQEKAIISRYELSDADLDYLEGQFRMNTSKIKIPSDNLDNSLIEQIKAIHYEKIEYYIIDETSIRASQNLELPEIEKLICKLRKQSDSSMCTKISSHADDLLYNYICDNVIYRDKNTK